MDPEEQSCVLTSTSSFCDGDVTHGITEFPYRVRSRWRLL